ncbi:unnamed protein product [Urochloa humidicola]
MARRRLHRTAAAPPPPRPDLVHHPQSHIVLYPCHKAPSTAAVALPTAADLSPLSLPAARSSRDRAEGDHRLPLLDSAPAQSDRHLEGASHVSSIRDGKGALRAAPPQSKRGSGRPPLCASTWSWKELRGSHLIDPARIEVGEGTLPESERGACPLTTKSEEGEEETGEGGEPWGSSWPSYLTLRAERTASHTLRRALRPPHTTGALLATVMAKPTKAIISDLPPLLINLPGCLTATSPVRVACPRAPAAGALARPTNSDIPPPLHQPH